MKGFIIITANNYAIRFEYYMQDAPLTCLAFSNLLPFTKTFIHSKYSGNEFWNNHAEPIDIIQENASIYVKPGEVVYGPMNPQRVITANAMGVYYGDGKGQDSCNIFARVYKDDMHLLEILGNSIWKNGNQNLIFKSLE